VEDKSNKLTASMARICKKILNTPIRVKKYGGFKKEYLKSRPTCKVTFRLPKEVVSGVKKTTIVGEFSNWANEAYPMKKLKNGDFTVTIELDIGKEYRFRYLIDDTRWINDWYADKYVKNPYGGEDSVVIV
jgi:1,4-alpha-glucan branching enzyme